MKSKFPGYFKPTKEVIKELWDNALITLDANILLNLYRYSDETREEFFKVLNSLKSRVWIPHQSAQEFFDNRLRVISQQEKSYEEAIQSLKSIEEQFQNSRQHPFLSNKLLDNFTKLKEEICAQLERNKDFHKKRITEDDVLSEIEALFESRVGEEFSEVEIEDICRVGEIRYKNKVPPGYKDASKSDDSGRGLRKYGDYIVWKQIIQKSKELGKGVILVTDDRKEDWWVKFNGKTISPRPELIREFHSEAEQSFHMYQSDRFLEFARTSLDEEVNEKAIQEIRELRKRDEERIMLRIQEEQQFKKFHKVEETIIKEKRSLEGELLYVQEKWSAIENALKEQQFIRENTSPKDFDERLIYRLKLELEMYESKIEQLNLQLLSLNNQEKFERRFTNINKWGGDLRPA